MTETFVSSLRVDVRHPAIHRVLGGTPGLETLANGLQFTEGPVWNDLQQCLYFSDIPSSRIFRWQDGTGLTIFRDGSHMANGLALDPQGRLLACEHATSRLTRTDVDGALEILAERYDGKELNSPNDVIIAPNGTIIFTDPAYGREAFWGVCRTEEMGFRGVYAIELETGELRLLSKDFIAPNGLCLSECGAFLFVNDSERNTIRRFRLNDDLTLEDDICWATLEPVGEGSADGMKIDRDGNLFCCGPGGIHVFSASADCLGIILMPEFAANLAFGGPGLSDMFITATTSLYRVRMPTSSTGHTRQ